MNTIFTILNYLNITDSYTDSSSSSSSYSSSPNDGINDKSRQYYTAINVHKRVSKDINQSQQDSEYRYDDELYNYPVIQRKMLGDKPIILDKSHSRTNSNITTYATSMKTPYEIHGDRVLINAQYYTFWISIDEFNRLKN